MKKTDIKRTLKDAGITFEIFWNQKDRNCSNYELKLIKDKNTSLWIKLGFNIKPAELEDIIKEFNKFDYRTYMQNILHAN